MAESREVYPYTINQLLHDMAYFVDVRYHEVILPWIHFDSYGIIVIHLFRMYESYVELHEPAKFCICFKFRHLYS